MHDPHYSNARQGARVRSAGRTDSSNKAIVQENNTGPDIGRLLVTANKTSVPRQIRWISEQVIKI